MTDQFLTDRTKRQLRNLDLVVRLLPFAEEHSRRETGTVLKTPDSQAQRRQMAEARQSSLDLRDAFRRATGKPSRDADGAWQDANE